MLGILLNMNGIPKRGEIEDLLLRWIVCGHDGVEDEEEHEASAPNYAKVGNLLAEMFIHGFWNEEHDGELLDGEKLYAIMFRSWKAAFVPRLTRALKSRGIPFADRFTEDDLSERFPWHWLESVAVEKLTLPTRQARRIGEALGGNEANSTIAMWEYMEKMDKAEISA